MTRLSPSRWLRSPALSIALFVLWLLLVQSLSVGDVVMGVVLALFWPAVTARFAAGGPRARRPTVMVKLFASVVGDMLKSNVEVMWAVVTRPSDINSRFVSIPLELTAPTGLTILAMIVTLTPGTAWVQLSADKRVLLLHVFSASADEPVVAAIKGRYERPLREIFE
jgi:multicomponent K+:H+ antiporter subunit E